MRLQRNVWLLLVAGLLVSVQPVYADQCSDAFAKAGGVFDSAREASNQKNYDRAAEFYEQAGKYYEEVANMKNCSCSKIHRSAQSNVKLSRDAAAEARLAMQYQVAVGKYDEGRTCVRNRQWDEATAAFLEAAQIWDSVGGATQGELGKNALESAKIARDAAASAITARNAAQSASGIQNK